MRFWCTTKNLEDHLKHLQQVLLTPRKTSCLPKEVFLCCTESRALGSVYLGHRGFNISK